MQVSPYIFLVQWIKHYHYFTHQGIFRFSQMVIFSMLPITSDTTDLPSEIIFILSEQSPSGPLLVRDHLLVAYISFCLSENICTQSSFLKCSFAVYIILEGQ